MSSETLSTMSSAVNQGELALRQAVETRGAQVNSTISNIRTQRAMAKKGSSGSSRSSFGGGRSSGGGGGRF